MKNSSKKASNSKPLPSIGGKVLPILKRIEKVEGGKEVEVSSTSILIAILNTRHPQGYSIPQMEVGLTLLEKLKNLPPAEKQIELSAEEFSELVRHAQVTENWLFRDQFIIDVVKQLKP